MKVIDVNTLWGTEREVRCPKGGFISVRPLLLEDNMGFTITRTLVFPGRPQFWHYKHHLEACYCVEGKGIITHATTGEEHLVDKDTLYVLNEHDPHTFQAIVPTVLICVFNPPLIGTETHGADGSY